MVNANPFESPATEEAQPPQAVTKARVLKEVFMLAGYVAGVTILPFAIAWAWQLF